MVMSPSQSTSIALMISVVLVSTSSSSTSSPDIRKSPLTISSISAASMVPPPSLHSWIMSSLNQFLYLLIKHGKNPS